MLEVSVRFAEKLHKNLNNHVIAYLCQEVVAASGEVVGEDIERLYEHVFVFGDFLDAKVAVVHYFVERRQLVGTCWLKTEEVRKDLGVGGGGDVAHRPEAFDQVPFADGEDIQNLTVGVECGTIGFDHLFNVQVLLELNVNNF